MKPITESHIETFSIEQLQLLGWQHAYSLAITEINEWSKNRKCAERNGVAITIFQKHTN